MTTNGNASAKAQIEPVKIFAHASAFHKSCELLQRSATATDPASGLPNDQLIGIIAHPAMALSAFASELYLKCLLSIETGTVPRGHDLHSLFLRLKAETRHELDDLWDIDIRQPERSAVLEEIRKRPGAENFRLDLRYALEKGAKGFEELRYFYEEENSFFLLSDFPYLLRKVILPSLGRYSAKTVEGLPPRTRSPHVRARHGYGPARDGRRPHKLVHVEILVLASP